uniref:Cystatin domain-containing protein n=1 Tax=Stomoxys calcitrans TaxID=35570 RepID=A0A1I8NTJ0_STOCA
MMKLFVIVLLATLAIANAVGDTHCPGCVTNLKTEDAAASLNKSLNKLATGDGPHYRLGKVNSASKQVIRGLQYRINADLIDENGQTKTCDINMVFFQGVEITFKCPGEDDVTKTHEPV